MRRRHDDTAQAQPGWWLWRMNVLALVLWPLSLLFCALALLRRDLYQRGLLTSTSLPKPLVVVGNISLGGSGKSPIVALLVETLSQWGYHVGIVTRGYQSDLGSEIRLLARGETDPQAGDEANMLSELVRCPVAVGADRVRAGQALLQQHPQIDLVISDDGLQHYALARQAEIIVLRRRALGNGFCLPAGPLREPRSRLQRCDLLIDRDSKQVTESFGECWNLQDAEQRRTLESFRGTKLYALAAIAFPQQFFDRLRDHGLDVVGTGFPDHFAFSEADIAQFTDRPLLVTHKDSVKLRAFAGDNVWVVPLELNLADELQCQLKNLIENLING